MKIKIMSESDDASCPYAHIAPIVEMLVRNGNKACDKNTFYLSQDGWRCDLEAPIDFDLVRKSFDLPTSLVLAERWDSIWCRKSWIEIRGPEFK